MTRSLSYSGSRGNVPPAGGLRVAEDLNPDHGPLRRFTLSDDTISSEFSAQVHELMLSAGGSPRIGALIHYRGEHGELLRQVLQRWITTYSRSEQTILSDEQAHTLALCLGIEPQSKHLVVLPKSISSSFTTRNIGIWSDIDAYLAEVERDTSGVFTQVLKQTKAEYLTEQYANEVLAATIRAPNTNEVDSLSLCTVLDVFFAEVCESAPTSASKILAQELVRQIATECTDTVKDRDIPRLLSATIAFFEECHIGT